MNYLVVGGRGEAGQSAIEAIRSQAPEAWIAATSSNETPVPGASSTIQGVDLADKEAPARIKTALGERAGQLRALFFTPAFGPIGYPVRAATPEDVREALQFSFRPMVELSNSLNPKITVGYSAFYWLPHSLAGYGSMAYAKLALEQCAIKHPDRFRVVRAGTFRSQATRGIGLLLFRKIRNTPHPELQELASRFEKSDKKFTDFFFEHAFQTEEATYGVDFQSPHRPTTRADLTLCNRRILAGESAPIINVLGDWIWTSDHLPELPEAFGLDHDPGKQYGV